MSVMNNPFTPPPMPALRDLETLSALMALIADPAAARKRIEKARHDSEHQRREVALTAREARLNERDAKLMADEATMASAKENLDRRLEHLRAAAAAA